MYVSEKRLAANRRNIELGREKAHETWHRIKERNQQLVECTATCEHCHKVFNKLIKQIDLDKNRLPRFCSRSCANSRIRTPEIKAKVSKTLCGTKTVGGKRIEISVNHSRETAVESRTCKRRIVKARKRYAVGSGFAGLNADRRTDTAEVAVVRLLPYHTDIVVSAPTAPEVYRVVGTISVSVVEFDESVNLIDSALVVRSRYRVVFVGTRENVDHAVFDSAVV